MNLGDALAWLDRHQNLERILADSRLQAPDPERMRRLAHVMGDPQASQPVIHLTGTNGKTSAARAVSQLLITKGLNVGTFISPHLQRLNERIMVGLQPISDADLAEVLTDLAGLEDLLGDQMRPTWFELLAAGAFRYFADRPVDVAVIEVGMGGRWDATNIADGTVSIVTNVALDHTELLGPPGSTSPGKRPASSSPGRPSCSARGTRSSTTSSPQSAPRFSGWQGEISRSSRPSWPRGAGPSTCGLPRATTTRSTSRSTGATRPTTSWLRWWARR